MHRFASLQGLTADAKDWEDLEHIMKDAFNAHFLHIKEGTSLVPGHTLYPDSVFYGNNTVTANILPLAFGLVPKAHIKEVAKKCSNHHYYNEQRAYQYRSNRYAMADA